MSKFTEFAQRTPVGTSFVVGYQAPGGAGDDARYTFDDIFSFVTSSLGTASVLDTGVGAGELPTNADLAGTFQAVNANLTSLSALGAAADRFSYTTGVNTYAETALTAFARTLLDDTTATTARTTLGSAIGADVQAWDAILDDLSGLTQATDKLPYFNSATTAATADLTSFARTLLDDTSALVARGTLGLDTTDDVAFADVIVGDRLKESKGSDVASANDMTLGSDGNSFTITGTTQINTIAGADWSSGNVIILEFAAAVTVADATAGTGLEILLAGGVNFVATAGDMIMLWNNGTNWKEISRTVI